MLWLLNITEAAEAPGGFVPVEGIPLNLTVGAGSTSGGKLPESVRQELLGGFYQEGALRLEVELVNPAGTQTWDLMAVAQELGETSLTLFGFHPTEPGELQNPDFSIAVTNVGGQFTPGYGPSVFAGGDTAGWGVDVTVREYLTSETGGSELFRQRFALAEVATSHTGEIPVATLFAVHPVGGWLSVSWKREDGTDLDWQGFSH